MTKPNKIVSKSGQAKRKPPAAGKGRPKGAQNKTTKALKDMVLGATERAGGEDFLLRQARKKNNAPFMALLAKILPMQVTGEDGGPLQVQHIKGMTDEQLKGLIQKVVEASK